LGLDHAANEVVRLVPTLIPRLLNFAVAGRSLRFADTSVRSREFRADQVLLVGEMGEDLVFGWHLEFQAGDDRREFWRWIQKNAALNEQLKRPILLVVLYLQPSSAPNVRESRSAESKTGTNSRPSVFGNSKSASAAASSPNLRPF
jgi:hypothetical protein